MKNILSIILASTILTSCNNNNEQKTGDRHLDIIDTLISEKPSKQVDIQTQFDQITVGMTIEEIKLIYKDSEFMEEPVYEYGIDGESTGLTIKKDNQKLFFVWTMEGDNRIRGITILSGSIKIDDNVHIGMTLRAFTQKYPNIKVNIDMMDHRYEFLYVPEKNYRIEFMTADSTRVARYDYKKAEPEYIEILRPYATIDRISINQEEKL